MSPGAQQHSADQVGGGDARRPFDDLEPVCSLDKAVAVLSTAVGRDIITVYYVFAAEVSDPVQMGDVRRIGDGFRDPSAGIYCGEPVDWRRMSVRSQSTTPGHGGEGTAPPVIQDGGEVSVPFLQGHDRRTLILQDVLIRVDADVELAAQLAGLDDSSGMACIRVRDSIVLYGSGHVTDGC